jgi:glycosyltransferase involved in cell wall biosynthesis
MRLLYACAYLPAEGVSGGAARLFRVLRGMAAAHEVHVLAFYEHERELASVPELREICASVRVIRRGQSLEEWRRDLLHQVPPSIALEFSNDEMRRALAVELNSARYDLANLEFLQMTQALPAQRQVPTVLTHHEVQHRVLRQQVRAATSKSRKLALGIEWLRMLNYEVRACRRYERVLAMSATEANALQRWDARLNVGFNNTGVDCAYFQPSHAPAEPRSMVFVGYFRHRPNVEAVLHFHRTILPRIRATVPDVRLVIVGGEPPPEIEALAADPAVRVTGWVPDIRPFVHQAEVVVVPIVSGAGLRGKVIEAWAMGKPVVSTSLGVDGLAVVDGQNVLVADTAADFADAVSRLLTDSSARACLASAGRETAQRCYDWSVTLGLLEAEYERVLERHR